MIDKRTIVINDIHDKNVTVLVSKKNKNVTIKNGISKIYNLRDRVFCIFNNCSDIKVTVIPSKLNKTKVFVEPPHSEKLRNIVTRKYINTNRPTKR